MPPNPPVDPSLEEIVARAIYASWFAVTVRETDIPDRLPDGFVPVAQRVLAALTTEDLKALLQARSDEVVALTAEDLHAAADKLTPTTVPDDVGIAGDELATFVDESTFHEAPGSPEIAMAPLSLALGVSIGILAARSKLSTALENE